MMMTRKRMTRDDNIVTRRRMLQVVGAGGTGLLAGCASGGTGGNASGGTGGNASGGTGGNATQNGSDGEGQVSVNAGSGQDITIGSPVSLTGQFAPSGQDNKDAITLAIQDFTKGRKKVEGNPQYVPSSPPEYIGSINVLFRDTQLKASVGTRKMRQLIKQQNVTAIVGGVGTSVTIGMAKIAEELNKLTVLTGTGNTTVTGSKRGKFHFRTYPNAYTTSKTLAKHLVANKGLKSWYIIYSDYGWGHDNRDNITEVVKSNGGEVVGTSPVPFGATDYSSQITKMQNSGAEMGMLAVFDLDAVNALKQANQFGLKDQMELGISIWTVPESKGLTKDAMSGVWGTLKYYYTFENKNNYNFVNRFHRKFGRVPSSEASSAYKSAMETLKAIERAKSTDSADIVPELEGARFTYFKDAEEYYRKCDHQCIQPDNVGYGYEGDPPANENLPSVDFPRVKNVKRFTEEDGIWRKCENLPGNMPSTI